MQRAFNYNRNNKSKIKKKVEQQKLCDYGVLKISRSNEQPKLTDFEIISDLSPFQAGNMKIKTKQKTFK